MSWRVVVVTERCKLEYRLGYLVCRGEQTKKVFINEIQTLIIESTAVSITSALLCELIKNKINIVFCDEKHNPLSQLVSLYGRYDCSGVLKKQMAWNDNIKSDVWAEIIRLKIKKQMEFLRELKSDQADLLSSYIPEIQSGDVTNREGHSAKVYFNNLFGLDFKRGDRTFINNALNYGYTVMLSAFNREIVSLGYNTQLGVAHKNEFNRFNLSCDLMEPFRILIDRFIFDKDVELTPEYKHSICNVLNNDVIIGSVKTTVISAIGIYCRSVFNSFETGDVSRIVCYE